MTLRPTTSTCWSAGTKLTCFTSTNAQILTPAELLCARGFFDSTSVIHTAEIVVPPATLLQWKEEEGGGDVKRGGIGRGVGEAAGGEEEEWREELVWYQAQMGCNAALDSWCVPDSSAKASFTRSAKASYTGSSRPRVLAAECRIHQQLKASYTSSLRPHTLVAEGLVH
jgi:hypothetical protein